VACTMLRRPLAYLAIFALKTGRKIAQLRLKIEKKFKTAESSICAAMLNLCVPLTPVSSQVFFHCFHCFDAITRCSLVRTCRKPSNARLSGVRLPASLRPPWQRQRRHRHRSSERDNGDDEMSTTHQAAVRTITSHQRLCPLLSVSFSIFRYRDA